MASSTIADLAACVDEAAVGLARSSAARQDEALASDKEEVKLLKAACVWERAINTLKRVKAAVPEVATRANTGNWDALVAAIAAALDSAHAHDRATLLALVQASPAARDAAAGGQVHSGNIIDMMALLQAHTEGELERLRTDEIRAKQSYERLRGAWQARLTASSERLAFVEGRTDDVAVELANTTTTFQQDMAVFETAEAELRAVADTFGTALHILEREIVGNPGAYPLIDTADRAAMLTAIGAGIDSAPLSDELRANVMALVRSNRAFRPNAQPRDAASHPGVLNVAGILQAMKAQTESELVTLQDGAALTDRIYRVRTQSLENWGRALCDCADFAVATAAASAAAAGQPASQDAVFTVAVIPSWLDSVPELYVQIQRMLTDIKESFGLQVCGLAGTHGSGAFARHSQVSLAGDDMCLLAAASQTIWTRLDTIRADAQPPARRRSRSRNRS